MTAGQYSRLWALIPTLLRFTQSTGLSTEHNYEMYFNALQELKLIKDVAERALGLVTEFHNNIVMCNTNQQQHIY